MEVFASTQAEGKIVQSIPFKFDDVKCKVGPIRYVINKLNALYSTKWTILDNSGPYQTILDYTRLYQTIPDYTILE